jgi:hypothetical protein
MASVMSLVRRAARHLPRQPLAWGTQVVALPGDARYRRAARTRLVAEPWDRVYCFHVPKTAGTSLHRSFMGLGGEDGRVVHERVLASASTRSMSGPWAYQAHSRTLLRRGAFHYGWSHRSWDELDVPAGSFRIVTLRDPVERVLSLYRMLMDNEESNDDPLLRSAQGRWVGRGFDAYLDAMPTADRMRQLSMFSTTLEPAQAAERIASCEALVRTESFAEDRGALGATLGVDLGEHHARRSDRNLDLEPSSLDRLRESLEPEYRMLAELGL